MYGYTGSILRIDLTERTISRIDTADYVHWGGGHGIGSAIFFDLVPDKTIDGFDPANVLTIMTSPLTGTMAPGATARTEMQGIGVQSSPIGWFTRSNFGGRFGPMLKYAGWDGIVIEGAADRPVWVDIRNDTVRIRDASGLWGRDTCQTQQQLWREVCGADACRGWHEPDGVEPLKRSTQRPAVLCIGQAGENKGRIASVIHDAGNGAGQGGFGGVWGAKNLKAISVIGTGSIAVADAAALMEARTQIMNAHAAQMDRIRPGEVGTLGFNRYPQPLNYYQYPRRTRPQGCMGCHAGCRLRLPNGSGNESSCMAFAAYNFYDIMRHSSMAMKTRVMLTGNFYHLLRHGRQTSASYRAADLLQQYGINAFEIWRGLQYMVGLWQEGQLGPGRAIDVDLQFSSLGSVGFIEDLTRMIAYREGAGDDMAEGFYRAAERWGRLDQDLEAGTLKFPHWGLPEHFPIPAQIEWGYGSILSDRDVNEHDFCLLNNLPSIFIVQRKQPPVEAEELVTVFSEKLYPWQGNSDMLDFSTANMYSEAIAQLVAWHRHYTRFWKQSALFCDFLFGDFYNPEAPDHRGFTGTAAGEQKIYNAVTGQNLSFEDGMELGRKIWNLDNAIWSLQGRQRDMVHFADYIYTHVDSQQAPMNAYRPGRENGQWKYVEVNKRSIDREKFETFKTNYYDVEGWDAATGRPTRTTLDTLGLEHVADELAAQSRLGAE